MGCLPLPWQIAGRRHCWPGLWHDGHKTLVCLPVARRTQDTTGMKCLPLAGGWGEGTAGTECLPLAWRTQGTGVLVPGKAGTRHNWHGVLAPSMAGTRRCWHAAGMECLLQAPGTAGVECLPLAWWAQALQPWRSAYPWHDGHLHGCCPDLVQVAACGGSSQWHVLWTLLACDCGYTRLAP